MTNGCLSMGREFNPDGFKKRVDAHDPNHWVGTLGNVKNGKYENHHNHKVSLFGRNSVIGRGIVLFENRDDGGEFSTRESQQIGSVGRPVACGIVGRLGGSFV
uniref:Superoxide dismutase copper/zinc binding domain-containing protein n=1 Tax=Panagrolaimus superbus TaxID=310955 RepID=A0A914YEE8_9BILA